MAKRFDPILPDFPHFLHGGDYNPDHWLSYEGVVDEDFRLMDLAGCNTFSVGIFSWTMYEPEEGVFQFDWLDRIMDRMAKAGKKVLLATPSGSKPAWMSIKYPEIRRVSELGVRDPHGGRHNHAWNSPVYRDKVWTINSKLAERYGQHPALGLWHISNEYNGEDFSELSINAFRHWLKEKYGDLDTLNAAWWTGFWSHIFTDWDQIDPRDTSLDGMRLDWKRFHTHQIVDFYLHEVAAVRQHSDKPVTTNMIDVVPGHGLISWQDYWRIAEHCDVICDDLYQLHHDRQDIRETAAASSFLHDLHRTMKGGKPFFLMETTPSNTNWHPIPRLKRPGQHLFESLEAVAHGADGVLYFQWRKGRGGCEKFHGAVVDHEGSENTRVFQDVAELGRTLEKLTPVLGSTIEPEVAILHDWEIRWALETSQGPRKSDMGDKGYYETCVEHYRGFWEESIPCDIIESASSFDPYKVIVAPMLFMLKEGVAERLRAFVENGGVLLTTYLSGVVNPTNLCFRGGWPGEGLRELFGVWAEEIDSLYDGDRLRVDATAKTCVELAPSFDGSVYADLLHAEGAEVLAAYGGEWYAGRPAFTVNRFGAGHAYYLATRPAEARTYRNLARFLARSHRIRGAWDGETPDGVIVSRRESEQSSYLFFLNYTSEPKSVSLEGPGLRDILLDEPVSGAVTIPGFGLAVLERKE